MAEGPAFYSGISSDQIKEKIPVDYGVGVKWDMSKWETDAKASKLITVLEGKTRVVYGEVSTFKGGFSPGAKHYYAVLKFSQLSSQYLWVSLSDRKYDNKIGDYWRGSVKGFPKIADMHRIEVTHAVTEDMYSFSLFDQESNDKPRYQKGEMTPLYDSRGEAIEAIKSEFNRIFGEGWVLNDENMEDREDEE